MNTFTTFLLHLIKTAIALLLGLFSFHQLAAQDAGKEQIKTMRLKVLKEVNGQLQVIDTTVQVADHKELMEAMKGMQLDSAVLRRLNANISGVFIQDSARSFSKLRDVIISTKDLKADTARLRALQDGKLRIYKLDKELSAAEREAWREKMKQHASDTAVLRRLNGNHMIYIHPDSVTSFDIRNSKLLKGADVIKLRSANPNVLLRASKDSAGVFRLNKEGVIIENLNPVHIERIVVQQQPGTISLDSLMASGAGSIELKVITDEKTGEKKVYRIDGNGREVEMKGERLQLDHRNANFIKLLKARIEDITEEDKAALKEAGAPVEKKARHELDVAEISFYPNPNDGRFNLSFTLDDKATTRVSVLDSKGQEVFVDTVEKLEGQYNRQIDLTPFGRGIYYLQIAQGKKYHTKRILVQ